MRISVWSPDVCSPDLGGRAMAGSVAFVATRKIDEPSAFHAIDARLAAPETVDDYASVVERLVDQKLTDGWPVVPPDAEGVGRFVAAAGRARSEEHTSDLPSLMRISYAVFGLKPKTNTTSLDPNTDLTTKRIIR